MPTKCAKPTVRWGDKRPTATSSQAPHPLLLTQCPRSGFCLQTESRTLPPKFQGSTWYWHHLLAEPGLLCSPGWGRARAGGSRPWRLKSLSSLTGAREHRNSPLMWEKQAMEEGPKPSPARELGTPPENLSSPCVLDQCCPQSVQNFIPPLQNSGSTEYPGFLCKG